MKLEAWAVGITAGSREVPGRKGLWQETSISYNNNNNNKPATLKITGCNFSRWQFPSVRYDVQSTSSTKVKVKRSRYRPGVAQRVGRGIALFFHDRGTRRGWVVSSTPRSHFLPRERPGTLCTGGWVGPRAGLDGRKISYPPGFDPGSPSPKSIAIPTELRRALWLRIQDACLTWLRAKLQTTSVCKQQFAVLAPTPVLMLYETSAAILVCIPEYISKGDLTFWFFSNRRSILLKKTAHSSGRRRYHCTRVCKFHSYKDEQENHFIAEFKLRLLLQESIEMYASFSWPLLPSHFACRGLLLPLITLN